MDPIPVTRATTLIPYLDFLSSIGAPVKRELQRLHLPADLSAQPECYIPALFDWEFKSRMAHLEGIEDLGLRVAAERIHDLMTPALVLRLLAAPTLLRAIQVFGSLCRRESSGMRVSLSRQGDNQRFFLTKTFEPGTPGYTQTEWTGLIGMMEVIRLFAGKEWQPDLVSLRSSQAVPLLAYEIFPDTRFLPDQPCTFVTFPKILLSLGLNEYGAHVLSRLGSESKYRTPVGPAADLAGSLKQLIQSYLPSGYPPLALAAKITGMNARTLQRRLAEIGYDYSTLIAETRVDVATRLLAQTDAPLIDIAYATGYRDPSHFSRAFRRFTGCTPQEYRHQRA